MRKLKLITERWECNMSQYWDNITDMHLKFGADIWVRKQLKEKNYEVLRSFLLFRLGFIQEELNETLNAHKNKDAEETVDGLIDIIVVALGTLDLFGVDADRAWQEVAASNITKEVGVKASRPNPLGVPDLVKPTGWVGPNHSENHGILPEVFEKEEK